MSNRKTPNFAYGNFPMERDLICVKEFAYGSPKFLTGTFLNANIIRTLSIGYLLFECPKYIILGFMLFGEDMVKHNQLIPRGMIKKVRRLK